MNGDTPTQLDTLTDVANGAMAIIEQITRIHDGSSEPKTAEMQLAIGGIEYHITIERGHKPEPPLGLTPPI